MEDKVFENRYKHKRGNSLKQVSTHFGSLETERIPMVISLEGIPNANEYEKVVDSFYQSLKSDHPYQYQDIIGEGGMGIVEMVKDKKCLRSIAKKTLNPANYDRESIIRFTEEAQITAQLEHPNIVPVYEMGMDDKNRLFYTMKMVKGRNLKEILRLIKKGDEEVIKKFPLSNLLEIFTAVCDAMSYACSKKIVHRDLKPDNIMVGDYGEVYIVDWGLAKIIKNGTGQTTEEIPEWIVKEVYSKQDVSTDKFLKELRRIDSLRTKDKDLNISFNDVLIGTPQYMAPERISGEADECSEVYALGAILYNILTLELTVKGEDLEEIITKIFKEDIKSPLKFNKLPHLNGGKVPSSLAAVAMKALSAEPVERYHTVTQLRHEISAWEDGYITEAEKAGPWLVLWSNIKRHKVESSIGLIFLLLLIGSYTIYAVKLKQDKNLAEKAEIVALEQQRIAEDETIKILEKSKAVSEKITELQNLASELYERSVYYLRNNQTKKARTTIQNAIKLKESPKYFTLYGNIQQTLSLFPKSIRSYEKALKSDPDSLQLKMAIAFSKQYIGKPLSSYIDKLNFKDFLVQQKRFSEAAIISRELLAESQNMKTKIFKMLATTNLRFIRAKHLKITQEGGLILNISDLNIDDISALKGIPLQELNISSNPISDISALKGMPLEKLDISYTKVSNLKTLSGSPMKELRANHTPIQYLVGLNKSPINRLEVENTKVTSLAGVKTTYLTYVNLASTRIKSINGINFKSLRELNISNTLIEDLSPLANSQLTSLKIRKTNVTDLKHLAKTYLTSLDASECHITDFSHLKPLPLERLYLDYTGLKDFSFLAGKKLTLLSARGTAVQTISHLKGMPIRILDLSKTKISDMNPISNFPLEELSLNGCSFTKLPKFTNMSDMASIWLNRAKFKELPSFDKRNYKTLDFTHSSIKSLDCLQDCSVQYLNISHTRISDLSPLKDKSFESLILDNTKVLSLTPLSESLISKISVSRTQITDLSPLKKANLVSFIGHGLKIESPDFINKQTIRTVDLNSSTISDLSPLAGSNVESLNLAHTNIADLKDLKDCSSLKSLDLYSTKITSIQPILRLPIQSLIIGECKGIDSIVLVKKIKTLKKLIIPSHIKEIKFLSYMRGLKILGTTSNHQHQPVSKFWEKYNKARNDEQ